MEQQFIDYGTAKKLRELGMDIKCFGYYDMTGKNELFFNNLQDYKTHKLIPTILLPAPLYQQVEQWLWDERGIWVHVFLNDVHRFDYDIMEGKFVEILNSPVNHDSPIIAKIEGIKAAVIQLHNGIHYTLIKVGSKKKSPKLFFVTDKKGKKMNFCPHQENPMGQFCYIRHGEELEYYTRAEFRQHQNETIKFRKMRRYDSNSKKSDYKAVPKP